MAEYVTGASSWDWAFRSGGELLADPASFAAFVAASALLYAIVSRLLNQWKIWHVPGDSQLPLLGHTIQYVRNSERALDWFTDLAKRYGTFKLDLPAQPPYIIVTDEASVRHVLKDNFENYIKGPHVNARVRELFGCGIFNADGESWYIQRKTAARIFSVNNFRNNMQRVFVSHANAVCDLFGQWAEEGRKVNVQDVFFRFTLDSFGEIAFGVNLDSLHGRNAEFLHSFDQAQYITEKRFFLPFLALRKLIDPLEYQLKKHVKVIDQFAQRIIEQRRVELAAGNGPQRADLLSMFMALEGVNVSDQHLRDLIINFIIAGRDTTALCIGWSFYLLAKNPEVQDRLRREVDAVLQGQEPTYDTIKNLEYCEAVVSETLRLYPSIPKDVKTAAKDDTLPDGMRVRAGTFVIYAPYAMGRMESLWGTDCEDFRPERWMKAGERASPFKAGPRMCLGVNMAYLEAQIMIARVLQQYTLHLCRDDPVIEQRSIALTMKPPGLVMAPRKRSVAPTVSS